jgi:ectoine hydroxylase-related dioxygenase (phytanoyl-CoA dioxygenase family)
VNLHLVFKPMLKLFTDNPTSLGVQDAFFGKPTSIYTSLFFERGTGQPIHRDTPVFSTKPEYQYLGVWVALEEANDQNGRLMVIRGGHLVPELDREKMALERFKTLDEVPKQDVDLWNIYQGKVLEDCLAKGLKVEEIQANPGDVIIWHPQLPHGGSKIKDMSRSRESFVMHTTPVGVPVYHQDVFFNPKKIVPETAPWVYMDQGNRKYAAHEWVDFAHKDPHRPNEFIL